MIRSYLFLSIAVFSIGLIGAISRRNVIIIYMSVELMLNGVNIALVALSSYYQTDITSVIALMIIAVAAAEAALFFALFVLMYRRKKSLDADIFTLLKGSDD